MLHKSNVLIVGGWQVNVFMVKVENQNLLIFEDCKMDIFPNSKHDSR
jgi:hypothetical protein